MELKRFIFLRCFAEMGSCTGMGGGVLLAKAEDS